MYPMLMAGVPCTQSSRCSSFPGVPCTHSFAVPSPPSFPAKSLFRNPPCCVCNSRASSFLDVNRLPSFSLVSLRSRPASPLSPIFRVRLRLLFLFPIPSVLPIQLASLQATARSYYYYPCVQHSSISGVQHSQRILLSFLSSSFRHPFTSVMSTRPSSVSSTTRSLRRLLRLFIRAWLSWV